MFYVLFGLSSSSSFLEVVSSSCIQFSFPVVFSYPYSFWYICIVSISNALSIFHKSGCPTQSPVGFIVVTSIGGCLLGHLYHTLFGCILQDISLFHKILCKSGSISSPVWQLFDRFCYVGVLFSVIAGDGHCLCCWPSMSNTVQYILILHCIIFFSLVAFLCKICSSNFRFLLGLVCCQNIGVKICQSIFDIMTGSI